MKRGKREGVVALTQTEIMLVLAVVILLLLAAKNADLNEAREHIARMEAAALGAAKTSENKAANKQEENGPPDDAAKDAPVDEELVAGGVAAPPRMPLGAGEPPPQPAPPQFSAQTSAEEQTAAELLEETVAENARLKNENQQLREQIAARGDAADNVQPRREESPARESSDNSAAANLRKKIGCLPCWLGSGKPAYYSTFNITYYAADDKFRIAPHRHLQSNAAAVRDALAGALSAAQTPPRGKIGRADFLAFAEKIRRAKLRQYGGDNCRLAATINEEASGRVIKFIRDDAGFCPIYR